MKAKTTYVGNTICHNCKEPISIDTCVKSLHWAYGVLGVRWMLCSKKCAEKLRDHGEVPVGEEN